MKKGERITPDGTEDRDGCSEKMEVGDIRCRRRVKVLKVGESKI